MLSSGGSPKWGQLMDDQHKVATNINVDKEVCFNDIIVLYKNNLRSYKL